MDLTPELSNTLWFLMVLIGLGVALTYYVFHWRKFDDGYEKGEAADPDCVARDNPPDEWCKRHWELTPK